MLERPPTFEEIWRARIQAGLLALLTLLALVWVQWRVLGMNLYVGCGLSPLWNYAAFQLLSKLLSGRTFHFRLDPTAERADEVFDLVFTVAFLFSLMIGVYAVYDTWSYQAPTLPPG